MRLFRRRRRSRRDPRASRLPEPTALTPPAPSRVQGELPHYYDHVVRIGVEVAPQDEPAFLGLANGHPWQTQDLGGGRHDVRVAVSGAVLGSTGAALAEFRRSLNRAGVGARVVFAARLRPRPAPERRYLVMPRGWMTERKWLAAPVRALMAWRSRGTVQATSLAEARSRLADFADRNPEAGSPDKLVVVGPPDPPGASTPDADSAAVDLLDDWRFLLATTLLVGAGAVFIGLYVTVWRPEGLTFLAAIAFLVAIPCLFGVWQMFRRIPEGRINTWLPLGLTALAAPLAIALSNSSQDVYLEAFGIAPGEVTPVGPGRLFAMTDILPLVLFALLVSLGLFGLLRYFHLGRSGTEFLPQLMTVGAVCLYGLATASAVLAALIVPLERGTQVGVDHVAQYRSEGGGPLGHAGVRPSAVCVEPGEDAVSRIGPPLTTDRPVLYFIGENDVDLLWDREEGLTKVPRFSVSLTPVSDLDATCPDP